MARDIDYAAAAVKKSLLEKYGEQNDLSSLEVEALEKTIAIQDGERRTEGTRDRLLGYVRDAANYQQFWDSVTPSAGRRGNPMA